MRRMSVQLLMQRIDLGRPKASDELREFLFDQRGIDLVRRVRLVEEKDFLHT